MSCSVRGFTKSRPNNNDDVWRHDKHYFTLPPPMDSRNENQARVVGQTWAMPKLGEEGTAAWQPRGNDVYLFGAKKEALGTSYAGY